MRMHVPSHTHFIAHTLTCTLAHPCPNDSQFIVQLLNQTHVHPYTYAGMFPLDIYNMVLSTTTVVEANILLHTAGLYQSACGLMKHVHRQQHMQSYQQHLHAQKPRTPNNANKHKQEEEKTADITSSSSSAASSLAPSSSSSSSKFTHTHARPSLDPSPSITEINLIGANIISHITSPVRALGITHTNHRLVPSFGNLLDGIVTNNKSTSEVSNMFLLGSFPAGEAKTLSHMAEQCFSAEHTLGSRHGYDSKTEGVAGKLFIQGEYVRRRVSLLGCVRA